MELKYIARREGRLSSFLREEMAMSAGLMNRLKWQEKLFVNGNPVHTDYAVQPGDVITVPLDEPVPEYPAEQGNLTDELAAKLDAAETQTEIDDIYRPFRPKRRTRASIAKEKGLQPLADMIFGQKLIGSLEEYASAFVDAEKGVESVADAIQGAKDILAAYAVIYPDRLDLDLISDAPIVVEKTEKKEKAHEIKKQSTDGLDSDCAAVYALFGEESLHPDEISAATGFPLSKVIN